MNSLDLEQLQILDVKPRVSGCRIGAVIEIQDRPIVDFPGNPLGPQGAKVVSSLSREALAKAHETRLPVLLVFENDDPARPVIVDIVMDQPTEGGLRRPAPPRVRGVLDGRGDAVPGEGRVSLGRIVGVKDDTVLVEDGRCAQGPVKARTAVRLRNLKDSVVLLTFADGLAVIVGQVYAALPIEPTGGEGAEVVLRGGRVRIEADVELVLKAGACVVRLDARGKAVTTADQIVSRARGANKVQGGTVELN